MIDVTLESMASKPIDRHPARRDFLRQLMIAGVGAALTPALLETLTDIPPAGAAQITVGYCAPKLDDPGQVAIQGGFLSHAKALGMKVLTTNAQNDVGKQATNIDNLLAQHVQAIVAVPVDASAIVPAVKRANAAGVPFFCIDRAAFGGKVVMTVESNNYLGGHQAGKAMVHLLTKKYGKPRGVVLELQGDLGTDVAQLRGKGFDDVVKQYPDIQLIQKPTNWKAELFQSITQQVASSNPGLDGIYMHSDAAGIGVPAGLKEAHRFFPVGDKRHVILCSIDGTSAALDYIRKGYWDATASQPLPDFGIIARYVLMTLKHQRIEMGRVTQANALWSPATIKMGKVGLVMLLATTLVTKANASDPRLWGNSKMS
jgi:ABC-type sugar transport system substrate-binding protein